MTTNIEITELPERSVDGTPIIHVAISGTLTAERYAFLEEAMRKLIDKHGMIRVLLVLEDLEGTTLDAAREDEQFKSRHIAEIERVAVACATRDDKSLPPSAIPFADAYTRFFPHENMEQAKAWLME